MTIDVEQEITLTVRGDVDQSARDLVREVVTRTCERVAEPVLFAEAKLAHEPDPSRERPHEAEAVLTLSGTTLRAHVAAESMTAAIHLLDDRLRQRLDRYTSLRSERRRNGPQPHQDGDGTWHHGDLPTERPEWFSRPADERELVRHKTFAVDQMTPDEAADLLELLGHDFLLFTNAGTTTDAVIWRNDDGDLELADASGRPDAIDENTVTPIQPSKNAVRRCTTAEAIEELDLDLEPFVFFLDPAVGRGQIAYHRYDGHYGLITPAAEP